MSSRQSKGKWIATILVVVLVLLGCKSPAAGTLVVAVADLGNEVWLVNQPNVTLLMVASSYEYLFYRDAEGEPVPGLAEKWEASPDGLTYTFHLRKGIEFHDGWGELTAEDVKYSYELGVSKGSLNSFLPRYVSDMDKVEVIDRYTVVFRLKRFNVMFFAKAGREYSPTFPIVSKKYVEAVGIQQAGRSPIGTGPYKFVEHRFGEYIKFEAVENHWRKTPQFKTLIIKKVPEEATRVNMLKAGEADIIDVSLASKAEVVKAGFKIKSMRGAMSYSVSLGGQWLPTRPTFDAKYPWVGDPRDPQSMDRALKVRKALNLAVDRDQIVRTILAGEAEPSAVFMAFEGTSMYDPALKPYPYDPGAAKRLLAEAGYPNGFEMTVKLFATAGRAEMPILGQAVAMMWQQIGVNVKLENVEEPAFNPLVSAYKVAGLAWVYGMPFYEEPVAGYQIISYSKGTRLWTGVETAEMDKFIQQGIAEANAEQRGKLQRQIGQYVYDNYLMVPLAIKNTIWGVSDRVGDWVLPKGMSYGINWESVTHGPGFRP